MKDAATICQHLLGYAEPLLADLTDEHLPIADETNGKTAGWLIGHLCVTGDFMRRKAGRPPLTPKEWGPKFTIGSVPSRTGTDYPELAALRAAFDGIYRDLISVAPELPAELLASPSPFEPGRARFATFGAFLTWIMTGHLGYHVGKLYGWRGAAGLTSGH
jgi:hypothetical protein